MHIMPDSNSPHNTALQLEYTFKKYTFEKYFIQKKNERLYAYTFASNSSHTNGLQLVSHN